MTEIVVVSVAFACVFLLGITLGLTLGAELSEEDEGAAHSPACSPDWLAEQAALHGGRSYFAEMKEPEGY